MYPLEHGRSIPIKLGVGGGGGWGDRETNHTNHQLSHIQDKHQQQVRSLFKS